MFMAGAKTGNSSLRSRHRDLLLVLPMLEQERLDFTHRRRIRQRTGLVHSGTSMVFEARYTQFMQTELVRKAIIGGWALGLGVVAFAVELTSLGVWVFLVGLVLPPLVMLKLWYPLRPVKSMA